MQRIFRNTDVRLMASSDNLLLSVAVFGPQEQARGVVQIAHGMCGHKERFFPFMEFLAGNGYVCVIHDHRGHGASVKCDDDLGYMYDGGWRAMVDDMEVVRKWAMDKFSMHPYILIGHSMGSLAARSYSKRYDVNIDRLILCGTPRINRAAGLGKLFFDAIVKLGAGHLHLGLVQKTASAVLNRRFRKEGYSNAWACSDKDALEKYKNDRLCQFSFTANGYSNFLALMQDCFNTDGWSTLHPDMPVHFLSGADDPCRGTVGDFQRVVALMKSVGYKTVTSKIFPGMRHELLNETDHLIVWNYILSLLA